jgi:deoxyadenosine/deoxycytidine kinase
MNKMEVDIMDSWMNTAAIENSTPDIIIYLRTDPEVAFKRLRSRGTESDKMIELEYIKGLHDLHEAWLLPFVSGQKIGLVKIYLLTKFQK